MSATSDQILDASRDANLRERLTALRPAGVSEQQVWEAMTRLVQVDVGDGYTIAVGFRYALGQAGLDAGRRGEYVTDAQLRTALAEAFPAPSQA